MFDIFKPYSKQLLRQIVDVLIDFGVLEYLDEAELDDVFSKIKEENYCFATINNLLLAFESRAIYKVEYDGYECFPSLPYGNDFLAVPELIVYRLSVGTNFFFCPEKKSIKAHYDQKGKSQKISFTQDGIYYEANFSDYISNNIVIAKLVNKAILNRNVNNPTIHVVHSDLVTQFLLLRHTHYAFLSENRYLEFAENEFH